MLLKIRFSSGWVNDIMRFISLVTYSVVVNEMVRNKFSLTRGLKQGDPLSLYLFLICDEGLSSPLQMTSLDGHI